MIQDFYGQTKYIFAHGGSKSCMPYFWNYNSYRPTLFFYQFSTCQKSKTPICCHFFICIKNHSISVKKIFLGFIFSSRIMCCCFVQGRCATIFVFHCSLIFNDNALTVICDHCWMTRIYHLNVLLHSFLLSASSRPAAHCHKHLSYYHSHYLHTLRHIVV